MGKHLNALIMRSMFRRGIEQNSETMKGVYEELARNGIS